MFPFSNDIIPVISSELGQKKFKKIKPSSMHTTMKNMTPATTAESDVDRSRISDQNVSHGYVQNT